MTNNNLSDKNILIKQNLMNYAFLSGLDHHIPWAWKDVPKWLEEPIYNADIHLNLCKPSHMYTLDFQQQKEITQAGTYALSTVLNVLSETGVKVVREIIERNIKNIRISDRIPTYLRGLGYTSKFIRAMNECPRLAEFVSDMAGTKLIPHAMVANYSHVNIGKVGMGKNVDSWHVDSVPYVLVTVLSDQTNSQGGALQMVKRNGLDEARQVVADAKGNPEPEELITVPYVGPGSGLFMQGSKIMHRVTPVVDAKEARISMVFSWMPADCFVDDATSLDFYKKDPEGLFEFTRLKAWRVMNQLRDLVERSPYTEDAELLAERLRLCSQELERTADLITGKMKDGVGYYNEAKQTMALNSVSQ